MRLKAGLTRALTHLMIVAMVSTTVPVNAAFASTLEADTSTAAIEAGAKVQQDGAGSKEQESDKEVSAEAGVASSDTAQKTTAEEKKGEAEAAEEETDQRDPAEKTEPTQQKFTDTLRSALKNNATESDDSAGNNGSSGKDDADSSGKKDDGSDAGSDGTKDDGSKDGDEKRLAAGTYSVTANLAMPGKFNPVITGLTVYANNPDNPFADNKGASPVVDENTGVKINANVPSSPLSDNAQLIVDENGNKTLVLMVRNPVFTLQELGTCPELSDVKVERTTPQDPTAWTYGKKPSRIHKIAVKLTDTQVTGEKSYNFAGSYLYAVPLEKAAMYGGAGPDIRPQGDCALQLTVNYSSAIKRSESTEVPTLVDLVDKSKADGTDKGTDGTADGGKTDGGASDKNNGENSGNSGNSGDAGQNGNGSDPDSNNASNNGTNGGQGNVNNNGGGNAANDSVATTTDGHFAAGTYTVSGNIWLPKSQTGLPLNPHITNSGFPPSTPVSANATMAVDANGHAYVRIPIVIQDKVMVVKAVSGSGVSYNGSTVTIDLGTPSSSQKTFTGTCQVSVTIGWLAQTIAAGIFNGVWDHTWTASWQVNLGSTLPAPGGGTLPAEAQAILSGLNGTTDASTAQDAALAALEETPAEATESKEDASAGKKKAANKSASGVIRAMEKAVEDATAANPVLAIVSAVFVVAVVVGAVHYAVKRKKNGSRG